MGPLGRGVRRRDARRDPASSRNAPPAPTACRAGKRSAAASARSCRSTASAATGQPTATATTAEPAASSAGDEPAGRPATRPQARSAPPTADPVHTAANGEPAHDGSDGEPPADDADHDPAPTPIVDLPDVAWISARDGTRAPGDLEDQAARYHPARHELTINADFRAITDLIAHWRGRYRGVPGARRDRGAGARMVRADPRRGRARRPQLELERGAARRAAVAELVHRRPAATTPAARDAPEASLDRSSEHHSPDGWRIACTRRRPMRRRKAEQATGEPVRSGQARSGATAGQPRTAPRSAAGHFASTHPPPQRPHFDHLTTRRRGVFRLEGCGVRRFVLHEALAFVAPLSPSEPFSAALVRLAEDAD